MKFKRKNSKRRCGERFFATPVLFLCFFHENALRFLRGCGFKEVDVENKFMVLGGTWEILRGEGEKMYYEE